MSRSILGAVGAAVLALVASLPLSSVAAPGDAQGPAFTVSDGTTLASTPVVARSGSGDFMVAWNQRDAAQNPQLMVRAYHADGTPKAAPLTLGASNARPPAVAGNAAGGFVVVWANAQVYAQPLDADGSPQGAPIQVNSPSTDNSTTLHESVAVAMDPAGDFAVAYSERVTHSIQAGCYPFYPCLINLEPGTASIKARRYPHDASSGDALKTVDTTHFDNTGKIGRRNTVGYAGISMADDGSYLVAWNRDTESLTLPRSSSLVRARAYSASNVGGSKHTVATLYDGPSDAAFGTTTQVAGDGHGHYVVAYRGASWALVNANGTPTGATGVAFDGTFPITAGFPGVAMDPNGNFALAWQSSKDGSIPANQRGTVTVQRYSTGGVPVGSNFAAGNDGTLDDLYAPIAMDASGNFVLAWTLVSGPSQTILARLYEGP